jgi:hypothetical protein
VVLLFLGALPFSARAEKEDGYTASDEFLPMGASIGGEWDVLDSSYLEDPESVRDAEVADIQLHKDERKLVFSIQGKKVRGRKLYYTISHAQFPSRVILVLYGVRNPEPVKGFYENLPVTGVVQNPFLEGELTEFIVFLRESMLGTAEWDAEKEAFSLRLYPMDPAFRQGFGVRIADSKIDPLPHIIEIKKELSASDLPNHLLLASDRETVVLESPFYRTREEAVQYLEELQTFGYKGKLAIRGYLQFPKPDRFEVVSEVVITGEDDVNLKNLAYDQLTPRRVHRLEYQELYRAILDLVSPTLRADPEALVEQYHALAEIYLNYETEDQSTELKAARVALKLFEVIYFQFPETGRADDALWDMANLMKRLPVRDQLSEEECYRKIVEEYPESMFAEEAAYRLGLQQSVE